MADPPPTPTHPPPYRPRCAPSPSASSIESFMTAPGTLPNANTPTPRGASPASAFDEDEDEDEAVYEDARAAFSAPALTTVAAPTDTSPVPAANAHARTRRRSARQHFERVSQALGFGHDNKARKALISFVGSVLLDVAQIVTIIVLLAVAAHRPSPTIPGMNEWTACGKPLGVWDALWAGRLTANVGLRAWRWRLDREWRTQPADAESGAGEGAAAPQRRRRQMRMMASDDTDAEDTAVQSETEEQLYPAMYSRLTLFRSVFTLVWFVLAHVFLYTSTNTCRFAAPHLWYLTLALLCVTYIAIVEVLLIALVVFILGPLVFLGYSIVLLCLGRHPIQNPGILRPEIGKLPRCVVDAIPLVIYIPAPPDDSTTAPAHPSPSTSPTASPTPSTPTKPDAAHTYPPSSPVMPPPRRRPLFAWLKRRPKRAPAEGEKGAGTGEGEGKAAAGGGPKTWEDNWARGAYPFVRLEGNRAACAICLMDFEAPPRAGEAAVLVDVDAPRGEAREARVEEVEAEVEADAEAEAEGPKLEDAGEGVQPLRLLECGHVFHKTCLDPWLTDVSGRCPVCQRPVEVKEGSPGPPEGGRRRRRRRRRREREDGS